MPTPLQQAEALAAALQSQHVPTGPGRLPWLKLKATAFLAAAREAGVPLGEGPLLGTGYLLVHAASDLVDAWEAEGLALEWNERHTSAAVVLEGCLVSVTPMLVNDQEVFTAEPALDARPDVEDAFQENHPPVYIVTHEKVVTEEFAELVQVLADDQVTAAKARVVAADVLAR